MGVLARGRFPALPALSCAAVAALAVAASPPSGPVLEAAKRGDVESVRAELRSGGDVNAAEGDGFTALHWAAKRGDAELAGVLLSAGADFRATTRLGAHQPLHVAAAAGEAEVAEALLSAGAPVSAPTGTGARPIHYAAASGSAAIVETLASHGADVNAVEPGWGQTPLMFAAGVGRPETVGALLEAGADPAVTAAVLDVAARGEADLIARRARQARVDRERGGAGVIYDPRERDKQRRAAQRRARAAAAKAEREKGRTGEAAAKPAEAPATAAVGGTGAAGAAGDILKKDGKSAEEAAAEQAEKDEHAEAHGHPEDEAARLAEEEEARKKAKDKETNRRQPLRYSELVGTHGGLTALLLAVRDGHREAAVTLMDGGADLDQRADGHRTTPLLMAAINGHYDIGMDLLQRGADPNLKNVSGAAPLYAAINARWISQPFHPQPSDHLQQETSHIEFMEALLDAGAEVDARLQRKQWYSTYNTDQLGVDRAGATAFWRAAYALDIPAMKMLVARGADPHIPTMKVPERTLRRLTSLIDEDAEEDPSGLPEVPYGGPGVHPIHAAAGVGYGLGLAANSHRHAPEAWLPAVKYLVEELGADPDARDHNGYSVIHHAASRGDNEMIEYLIAKGADPLAIARTGQTTVDLANGPVQRISPFPETIALLEGYGAKNNNRCVGC